ncbi:MAG: hypothetical protein WC248_01620 [Candidatus Methanomethylophilaceae archaeon]|jgi:hypothetical protein
MMEFTLARVTLGICGLLILAAVLSPVTEIFDDRETNELQEQADNLAKLFDSFYISEVDSMTLCMNEVLPSCDSTITFDGNMLTLISNEKEYKSIVRHKIVTAASFGSNDVVIFEKTREGITALPLNPR